MAARLGKSRRRTRAGSRRTGAAAAARRRRRGVRGASRPGVDDRWTAKAKERAADFLERFEQETGRRLDLSLDRIQDLDRYLEKNFDADPPLPEETVEAAGFYFAEIWRGAFGGEYLWDDERGALAIRKGSISVFPVEKVARVLRERTAGALEAYAFIYAKKTASD